MRRSLRPLIRANTQDQVASDALKLQAARCISVSGWGAVALMAAGGGIPTPGMADAAGGKVASYRL
jgi:hypothetical protein